MGSTDSLKGVLGRWGHEALLDTGPFCELWCTMLVGTSYIRIVKQIFSLDVPAPPQTYWQEWLQETYYVYLTMYPFHVFSISTSHLLPAYFTYSYTKGFPVYFPYFKNVTQHIWKSLLNSEYDYKVWNLLNQDFHLILFRINWEIQYIWHDFSFGFKVSVW